ncbi:MAG: hypothetical protein OQL17_13215 [Sedimenticola sp.]|uniref:Uncharacterized protein n=1 Tax=Sedimenticola thiotaurini TaxID=1543721 RepID=A0A558D987_9GAMM|nr:hypothetical protein [Sedimenticola sp.]MCW8950938.1 hypothetical protein [Sedimenticola sp.]MCW8974649.1 hypothetical protein [Sedimenticola sp.]MDF1528284.1 hypothetical protein [Sedimenticola sp.]TVT57533.1 MAG: hypothetical protein FHK82_05905 [Sedimenticola thiotaurini]
MKDKYHPNPAINKGFHYQQELESHLVQLKTMPESDCHLDALLKSLIAFREELKAGTAVVPGERIFSRHSVAGGRRVA